MLPTKRNQKIWACSQIFTSSGPIKKLIFRTMEASNLREIIRSDCGPSSAEARNQGPEIVASTGRSMAARQANLRQKGWVSGKDMN